jgi:hypothetical protein
LRLSRLSRPAGKLRRAPTGPSRPQQLALRDRFGGNLLAFGRGLRYRIRGLPWTCVYGTTLVDVVPRNRRILDGLDMCGLIGLFVVLDATRSQYMASVTQKLPKLTCLLSSGSETLGEQC